MRRSRPRRARPSRRCAGNRPPARTRSSRRDVPRCGSRGSGRRTRRRSRQLRPDLRLGLGLRPAAASSSRPHLTMWKLLGRLPPCWQAVAVSTDETPLAIWGSGATAPKAHRRQDVVLHAAGPWSRSVMALLKHLEAVGFEGAPRPVGDGFDADGREAITYIPGATPHPRAWDDDAIGALGGRAHHHHRPGRR
jgi:hypothetical protein